MNFSINPMVIIVHVRIISELTSTPGKTYQDPAETH